MANGRAHFLTNVAAGATMTALVAYYAPDAVAPVAVGATVATFVTPDADLEGRTHSEALLRQVPVLGIVFQTAWHPYAILHRHRGMSHWPVIGTAGRVAYSAAAILCLMLFWCGFVWYTGGDPTHFVATVTSATLRLANVYVLAAWAAQDLIHLLLDVIWKG